ncbi:flagellar assembly protein FliH [Solibacillus sp. FSL H8-0538]|uniref:flagellar assembly protein FliH n=1 Tax=Solibacillus sp. FSL H8-0538 TaxID=2921400 RepID=UPI0030FC340F
MSRIIRSTNAKPTEANSIEIKIRNMFEPESFVEELVDTPAHPQLTMEDIFEERTQLLAHAQQEIDEERHKFDQFRNEQLLAIEALKQTWEEERLVLQQQAYEEGFGQGYEEGIQKANADMAESLRVANETINQANVNAEKYIEAQEQVILELGLKTAERILGATLERDDELYASIIKRGLKEAREMKEVKVYVSPKYYGVLTKNHDELAEMFPPDVPFMIFVNEDLEDTESYIETNHGRIVVSIDEQLHELRLKLHEILDSKE